MSAGTKPDPHSSDEAARGNSNPLSSLVTLAKALRENPWYLSAVLVIYLDGYIINLCLWPSQSVRVFIIPELASGLVWICVVGVFMIAAVRKYLPFTNRRARYFLIASLIGGPATSVALPLMIGAKRVLGAQATEIHSMYGRDYRLLAPVIALACGLVIFAFLLSLLTTTLRASMARGSAR